MSGTREGALKAWLKRKRGPGLAQVQADTPPGLCPFCLEPLAPRRRTSGRAPATCMAPDCRTAWFRCWRRDQRKRAPGGMVVRSPAARTHNAPRPPPGPGLKQMRAAAKPGECPFCGDPVRKKPPSQRGRGYMLCGDPVCWTAFWRCYSRDYRAARVAS